MAKKVPIFDYHRIHQDHDVTVPLDRGRVDLSVFRRQMDYLSASGIEVVTHPQIADWLYQGRDLPERCVVLDFHDNRLNVFENAFPVLSEHGFQATVFVITNLADGKQVFGPDDYPAMGWDHLRQLRDTGWCIAPHTRKHLWLAGPKRRPKDHAEIWDELTESRRIVAEKMGIDAPYFSYPGGSWNHKVEAMVKQVYQTAPSTYGTPIRPQ